jgi:hypothetical protein
MELIPKKLRSLWIKGTHKLLWYVLTITDVFLNQKRVNVCEHMVKTMPQTYLAGRTTVTKFVPKGSRVHVKVAIEEM